MRGPLRVVMFGTYDEANHPRVRVLREGLVALGHDVEVVNVPLRLDTAARVDLARRPWRAPVVALRVLSTWVSLLYRSRSTRRPDVVLVGYMGHFDIHLARLRWWRAHLVVDHMVSLADTVRDRGLDGNKLLVKLLDLVDRAALRQADTVLVDTAEHLDSLRPEHQAKAEIVPVGAPQAWLDAGAARERPDDGSGALHVVFFGLYTPLQGAQTIGEAIQRLGDRDIRWTMIGTGQHRAATESAAGDVPVTWIDWVDAAELPEVVARHDVCLGIFGTGPKALRVTPNKVYQGAAAGCAIVTSDTAPQRLALGEAALVVKAGDPAGLADALAHLDDDRALLRQHQQEARLTAQTSFAPAVVVGRLATRLES